MQLKKDSNNFLFHTSFYKKYYLPFIFERKFLYVNFFQNIELKEILLAYNSLNLSNPLHNGLIANFFFLKLFTGKHPFFLPVKIISSFKHKSYNFRCIVRLSKTNSISFCLKYMSYASRNISSNDFGIHKYSLSKDSLTFYANNFPYLRIVETHPIFFKWNESLNITLNFKNSTSTKEIFDFLTLMKLNRKTFLL